MVLFEWVRSAEPPTSSGIASVSTPSAASLALRVASVGRSATSRACNADELACQRAGSPPASARSTGGAPRHRPPRAAAARPRASEPRAPAARQAASTCSGTTKGRCGQPSRSRAARSRPRPAARRGCLRSLLGGRAEADHRAAGDQRRPRVGARRLDGPGDGLDVMPVDPRRLPAIGLEAPEHIVRAGERGRPVDRDAVVVEQHDQSAEAKVPGERAASWLIPSMRSAVAGDHIGAVVDQRRGRSAPPACASASAMPTALAMPWPSGPVVVSTPAVWPYSGWPGVRGAELAEALQLLERHVRVAGEIAAARRAASSRGRPTARSGRGPASRVPWDRTRGSGSTARWRRPPCPSASPDGPTSLSRPRPSPGRGWRSPSRWRCFARRLASASRVGVADHRGLPQTASSPMAAFTMW